MSVLQTKKDEYSNMKRKIVNSKENLYIEIVSNKIAPAKNENQTKKHDYLKETKKDTQINSDIKASNQKSLNDLKKERHNFDNLLERCSYKNNIFYINGNKIIISRNINDMNKKTNNFINNKIKNNFIIIFLILFSFTYELKTRKIFSFSSNITLKLEGIGMLSVFYAESSCSGGIFTRPDEIYINDRKQNEITDKYNFQYPFNVIRLVWFNTINRCNCLFKDCINIIEIDFSKFDFSSGLYGNQMFYNCSTLTSINFHSSGNIRIYNLVEMFSYCGSLSSIDLSKFDISSITDTKGLFRSCHSLISLDLSNFSNGNLRNGDYTFFDCINLIYVNFRNAHYCGNNIPSLNNFLSAQKNIIFCTGCTSQIWPKINNHGCIVNDCSNNWSQNQKKLNLENNACVTGCSSTNNKFLYHAKCYGVCPDGTYIDNFNCKDCHPDCKICDKPPETDNANCIKCKSIYKYLNSGNCVYNCTNGFYQDETDNSIKRCKCDLIKCFKCSKESFDQNLCLTCNEGYYPKENDINNINSFVDCYQNPEGYYLDNNNNNPIYRLCYESCSLCDIGGNITYHNCVECKSDFYFELNNDNGFKSCYKNCSNYFYYDKNLNKYYCTEFLKCLEQYSRLIYEKRQCIYKCDEDSEYKYEFRKRCYKECPEGLIPSNTTKYYCDLICPEERPFELISIQECVQYCSIKDLLETECILNYESDDENKMHDIMLGNINHGFISEDYNISHLESGGEDVIQFGKMTLLLTTSRNQKNSTNNNRTVIDLNDCETSLRSKNQIPDEEDLFIKKIDVNQDGMKIPKIEYDIYRKITTENGTKLQKLDLSVCKNNRIDLSIPIFISEDLEKLNVSGSYFNDKCSPTTSKSGTDITLKDRRNEFIEKNETVCQDGCFISDYDYLNQRVKCSCEAKESSLSFKEMNINKTNLLQQFKDIKSIININIILCYKELFCKEGIINNINLFIIIPFIIFHLLVIIIFYCNQKEKLFEKIKDIFFGISNWHLVKEDEEKKGKMRRINNIITQDKKGNKILLKQENKRNNNKTNSKSLIKSLTTNFIQKNKRNQNNHYPPKKYDNKIEKKIKFSKSQNNDYLYQRKKINSSKKVDKNINNKNNNINLNKGEIIKRSKKIMELNYEEINVLPYQLALKYDKRTYCQYYLSLIQTKHILIFSFCYNKDYNSKIIKIDLFFISFLIFFTVNALFFNDYIMHQIYIDEGLYDFIVQLPQIVYSSLISSILDILIKLFAFSEENILEFKKNKTKANVNQRFKELNKKLKVKFILFFTSSFIFLLFFCYYLAVFGAIYKNTQFHLIKDTAISYGLSLIYPFVVYLIPGMFRIPSLLDKKQKKRICLYKASQIFQAII